MTMILGIDVETTGLDPEKDEVIELGFALWDWEKKKPVVCGSYLIKPSQPLSEEIKLVTGISDNDFNFQDEPRVAWKQLIDCIEKADYIMAHNAPFDKSFVTRYLTSLGFNLNKLWIDTVADVDYDKGKSKYKNLTYLGATHGFVNPFSHRALFDVLSMFKVANSYNLEEMIKSANSPVVEVIADVSFDQKDEAKKAGFNWEPSLKKWKMKIKKIQLDKISSEFKFKFHEIEDAPF